MAWVGSSGRGFSLLAVCEELLSELLEDKGKNCFLGSDGEGVITSVVTEPFDDVVFWLSRWFFLKTSRARLLRIDPQDLLPEEEDVSDEAFESRRSKSGNTFPRPSLQSQVEYMFTASLPRPKKRNTRKPQARRTQRSKATTPPVGIRMMFHHSLPWMRFQEYGMRGKERLM